MGLGGEKSLTAINLNNCLKYKFAMAASYAQIPWLQTVTFDVIGHGRLVAVAGDAKHVQRFKYPGEFYSPIRIESVLVTYRYGLNAKTVKN